MQLLATFPACVDCVAFIANGTVPEDRPELPTDIATEWPRTHLVNADERDEDGDTIEYGFSWAPCRCCGSRLGGNRGLIAALV